MRTSTLRVAFRLYCDTTVPETEQSVRLGEDVFDLHEHRMDVVQVLALLRDAVAVHPEIEHDRWIAILPLSTDASKPTGNASAIKLSQLKS
jgi:hypothetical protein